MGEVIRHLTWPVVLVGAYKDGRHNVMTAAWVSQVSLDPTLIMVSVGPARFTHDMIAGTGEFVVSVLARDQEREGSFCGSKSGREVDKIAALGLKTRPAQKIGVPLVEGCIANLECRLVARYPAGDHTLFIGEVVASHVERPDAVPLLMYRGRWGGFAH